MLVCPSGVAAGLFPMTCFNPIKVIPRSAFLLPAALQLLRQEGSLEPCVLPSPEDFIIAAATGLSFSNNQSNAIEISVLSVAPDVWMEPVPTLGCFALYFGFKPSGGKHQPCTGQLLGLSLCLSNERVVHTEGVTSQININQGPCVTPWPPVLAEPVTAPLWGGHLTCHLINMCRLCPSAEPGNGFASLTTRTQKTF